MGRLTLSATFNWREDDSIFIEDLLVELRQLAIDAGHSTTQKLYHRVDVLVSPLRATECLGLLAGLAEAGARVVVEIKPEG